QRAAEPFRFFLDQGAVRLLKGADVTAARLPGHREPALLHRGTEALVDGHATGRALARPSQETGQCLGRALRAGRNQEIVGLDEAASDLDRGLNSFRSQPVTVAGRVTPQLDRLHSPLSSATAWTRPSRTACPGPRHRIARGSRAGDRHL